MKNHTLSLPSADTILCLLSDIEEEIETGLKSELQLVAEGESAIELARAFVALRTVKDAVDATFKEFDRIYENMKMEKLPAKFESSGVPTINLDEGFRITVSHLVRAAIKGGKKAEAMQWLRDNQLGDIVTETVNSSTLSAVAKTMVEDNKELDPELFSVHVLPTTSVTKTK